MTTMLHVGIWGVIAYLSSMFCLAQLYKNRSIANFTWGGGVCLVTLYTFFAMGNFAARPIIASILTGIWGARLTFYLIWRQFRISDTRYQGWTSGWDLRGMLKTLAWVFGAQGFGVFIMSLPNALINIFSGPGFNSIDIIALALWLVGFCIESIADVQLYRFRDNPVNRGKILQTGLWAISRHPNYLGELIMWIALALLALSVPHGWYAMLAPLLAYTVLTRFSIKKIEDGLANHPDFPAYKQRVPELLPFHYR